MLKLLYSVLLVFMPIFYTHAQDFEIKSIRNDYMTKFENYTIESGLSNNNCIKVYQDKYGFIWIGTSKGLNRFDGHTFVNYYHNPDDSTSISGNFISDITEDKYGNLWIATHNGLNRYNREQEHFIRYQSLRRVNSISHNNIRKFLPDSAGFLWIETLDGTLNKLDIDKKKFSHYTHPKIIQPFYHYYGMLQDPEGLIWIGGRNLGPGFFDPDSEEFRFIETAPQVKGKKRDSDVACYFIDSYNTFWISGIDGIYTYDRDHDYFSKFLGTSTFSIIQSKDGIIWFASGNGIYTYNYKTQVITHYTNDENNSVSLIDNHISDILEDRNGNIWIATRSGLSKLDFRTNKFGHIYHIPENENSLASNKVSSIVQDNQNNLWIAYKNKGFDRYNLENKNIEHFQTKTHPGLKSDVVSKLYFDKGWNLWIGLWRGVGFNIYNPRLKEFKHYALDKNSRKRDWYSDFLEDNQGNYWIAVWGSVGLHKFNIASNKFDPDHFRPINRPLNKHINSLVIDKNQNLWIGTKDRLIYRYNINNEKFESFIYQEYPLTVESKKFLKTRKGAFDQFNEISHTTLDELGNPWFIASNQIIKYDLKEEEFSSFKVDSGQYIKPLKNGLLFRFEESFLLFSFAGQKFKNSHFNSRTDLCSVLDIVPGFKNNLLIIKSQKVQLGNKKEFKLKDSVDYIYKSFIDSKNQIWLFSRNQLIILDEDLNEIYLHGLVNHFNHTEIFCLHEFNDMIWIGTNNGLFAVEDFIIKQHYTFDSKDQYSLINNKVYSIYPNLTNSLWIGTEAGLCLLDMPNHKFIPYNIPGQDALTSHLTSYLLEDSKGNIWIGTTNFGLNKLDSETGKIQHYTHKSYDSLSISSNQINFIFEDSKSNLWIATHNGLNQLTVHSNFKRYGIRDGLPDHVISSITEDNDGNLWLTSPKGISKFDPRTKKVNILNKNSGLAGNHYNTALKLDDGRLAFGGENGINIFDPLEIVCDMPIPNIQITGFDIFNKIYKHDLTSIEKIKLSYKQNFFSIQFSSLQFSKNHHYKFYYKLENVDPDWNKINHEPKVSYTDIKPGHYNFHIKITPDDGLIQYTKKLKIIITPPFWKTYWFYSIVTIIILLVLAWMIRLKFRSIRAELAKSEIEQRMLRTQMNPHFIFNILTTLQNLILNNDVSSANKYLTRFSKLLRMILQNSRSTYISISEEVNTITNYIELQKLRYNNKFNYKIDVDNTLDIELDQIPPMLAQPFIENSIEHGFVEANQDYLLDISIIRDNNFIIYTIADNGIGIEKSLKIKSQYKEDYKSLGIKIMNDRMINLNKIQKQNIDLKVKDISTKTKSEQGTKVIITIRNA